MKISLNWLKQYVDINEKPEQVADLLTMHSCEVDDIINHSENLNKIIVGQIKNIRKHPNADKLLLVDTRINKTETVQIVCGGTNLRVGMFVPVALVGAKVKWHGEGDLIELQKVKLRGEESNGMICLDSEIGLGNNIGTEIMDLEKFTDNKLIPGVDIAKALNLGDITLEIDQKSLTHRSDLFCHLGIAREYAALTGRKLKSPKSIRIKESKKNKLILDVKDKKLCPYYAAIVLDNIELKESPAWMQRQLKSAGMRPINNIVDIANYVMLELGQPLHTFDYDKIKDQKIIVRVAQKNESIITLDKQKRALTEEMLLIADPEKPIAIAGIMGGANSEIDKNSKTIVIESANFDKVNVRRSGMRLGLHTEALTRFEKGLPINLSLIALNRAVDLFIKYANAEVSSKIYESKKIKLKNKIIDFNLEKLNNLSGVSISKQKVIKILNSLQVNVLGSKNNILKIEIPLFRTDLEIDEDIIEEVCRIYGYDNIKPKALSSQLSPVEYLADLRWGDELSKILVQKGFTETMNYSFYGIKEINKCCLAVDEHLELNNPVSDDLKYLRTSLLPYLLNNLKKNIDNNFQNIKLFEIGHVYLKPDQDKKHLALIQAGDDEDVFFQLKGIVEYLNKSANIDCKNIDSIKLIGQDILKQYGIDKKVAYVELDLFEFADLANTNKKFQHLPKFPAVEIDLSIILEKKYSWQEVYKEIKQANNLINKIELFDVFEGEKIGLENKSLAMHLSFQDNTKTLSMKEVEKFRDELMKVLAEKYNAKIRDK